MSNLSNSYASWHVWLSATSRVRAYVSVEIKGCDDSTESATAEDVQNAGSILRMIGEALATIEHDYKVALEQSKEQP